MRAEPDSKQPGPDAVLRPTPAGTKAGHVWRPLFDIVEDRWRERHGDAAIEQLRAALSPAGPVDLPDALPIVGQAMFTGPRLHRRTPPGSRDAPLPALLARALTGYAVEFERDAEVSLVAYADVLAFVTEDGVRLRELPGLGGVSREGVDVVVGHLERTGYVVVEPAPDRGKQVRLTEAGRAAQGAAARRMAEVEQHWHERFGPGLREALEALGPLTDLTSYSDGWRASVRRRLPDLPMVLHRGGYPDGA
ncbi:MAG TPA: hypothetical protein VHV74_26690 [Pseudonocardiaceae bacterium]|nr:hypothetical protein [Pseudonocardiaceae bacterium]